MAKPIGVFGVPENEFVEKIFEWRKRQGDESRTVPHLTLSVNLEFDGDLEILKARVRDLSNFVVRLELPVLGVKQVDQNVALEFDNSVSKNLARAITEKLADLNFEMVETNYMKIGMGKESDLKTEDRPEKIVIDKLGVVGGEIKEEDFYARMNL